MTGEDRSTGREDLSHSHSLSITRMTSAWEWNRASVATGEQIAVPVMALPIKKNKQKTKIKLRYV